MRIREEMFIVLSNKDGFVGELSSTNGPIARSLGTEVWKVTYVDAEGDIRKLTNSDEESIDTLIVSREFKYFKVVDGFSTIPAEFGEVDLIITYNNGETIEESGIVQLKVTQKSIAYSYKRKKFGFLKYEAQIELEISDLKQITVCTNHSQRVLHIENGVVIREHIMYDASRKFVSFTLGN